MQVDFTNYSSFYIINHILPNPGSDHWMSILAGYHQDLAGNDELWKNPILMFENSLQYSFRKVAIFFWITKPLIAIDIM